MANQNHPKKKVPKKGLRSLSQTCPPAVCPKRLREHRSTHKHKQKRSSTYTGAPGSVRGGDPNIIIHKCPYHLASGWTGFQQDLIAQRLSCRVP